MNPWWWVPIGLAAWFLVALLTARFLGPALRHVSQAREAMGQQFGETPDEPHEPPRNHRRAS